MLAAGRAAPTRQGALRNQALTSGPPSRHEDKGMIMGIRIRAIPVRLGVGLALWLCLSPTAASETGLTALLEGYRSLEPAAGFFVENRTVSMGPPGAPVRARGPVSPRDARG